MDFACIQAQLAQLTSQLTQNAERATMPSVPTFGASYGQGYQNHQCPQFSANEDVWGHQGFQANQCPPRDWSDHSNSMWWEAQQVQHEEYWQPYEEFYSKPMEPPQPHMQYPQSNSGSSIDYNQILNELNSLVQDQQNQAKETHQGEYWQPYEEFYQWPCAPPQPPPQPFQSNSSMSMDNDQIFQLLTSLVQDQQNQDKIMDNLKNQMGEMVESMAQIQEQRELSNSNIANSRGEVELDEPITLESDMEDEDILEPAKHNPNVDDLLLQEEDEEDDMGSLEELLPQAPQVPMMSNSGNVIPNSIHSNIIPPNVPFPRRFLIPNDEESEKDIVEALPKVQGDTPIHETKTGGNQFILHIHSWL